MFRLDRGVWQKKNPSAEGRHVGCTCAGQGAFLCMRGGVQRGKEGAEQMGSRGILLCRVHRVARGLPKISNTGGDPEMTNPFCVLALGMCRGVGL